MKHVFSNIQDIAHLWANQQQDNARNSGNYFFEGNTIFSYGKHFPIAQIRISPITGEKVALFTNGTYSNTTAKHVRVTHMANHLPVISMSNLPGQYITDEQFNEYFNSNSALSFHYNNIRHWTNILDDQFIGLRKAKKPEIWIQKIKETIGYIRRYCDFFNCTLDAQTEALIANPGLDVYDTYMKEKNAAIEAQKKKLAEIKRNNHLESLVKWRNFELPTMYSREGCDYLRVNKESGRVETSQGVKIPAKTARTFYLQLTDIVSKGGCKDSQCGTFMDYQIQEINADFIHIGCHLIYRNEVEKCWQDIQAYFMQNS